MASLCVRAKSDWICAISCTSFARTRPHHPLCEVQGGAEVLLRRRQALLGHVLGPRLNFVGCLFHSFGRAPGGAQEVVKRLTRLCQSSLGHVAHLPENLASLLSDRTERTVLSG